MKARVAIPLVLSVLLCYRLFASEGIVTLTCKGPSCTNEIQIADKETVKVRTYALNYSGGSPPVIYCTKDAKTINLTQIVSQPPYDVIIAGPAVVGAYFPADNNPSNTLFLSLEIQPLPFPPGKAVTVGPYAGNVQVTMEMSGDLVNWVPAVNGAVYTNSPDARFFRIKMTLNATP